MNASIVQIPLNKLCISPLNVRVVSPSKRSDKELLASLKKQGLLQNLVVVPAAGKDGHYEVTAGGRRYAGLSLLSEMKEISEDYPVECKITDREDATETSLSENMKADMHPADVFMAYNKLAQEGKSIKEIALSFGKSQADVKKLLKLASVEPSLVELFRQGKMDYECVMAMTVTDDQEAQINCWKEVSRSNPTAWNIRRFLLGEKIDDKNNMVRFVGLSTYKKAGGEVISDLFGAKEYIVNMDLLQSLCAAKLEKEADVLKQEGWKWVEAREEGQMMYHSYTHLNADYGDIPEELSSQCSKVEAEMEALEAIDEDWSEEQENRHTELEELLDQLHEKKEAYRAFTDHQKAHAGAIVTFDYRGDLCVHRGLLKNEDRKAYYATEESNASASQDAFAPSGSDQREEPVESNALLEDLNSYHGQAFQVHLMQNESLAVDLLHYTLITSTMDLQFRFMRPLNISGDMTDYQAPLIDETTAAAKHTGIEGSLNVEWMGIEADSERFIAYQKLSKKDKSRLLTYCSARLTQPSINGRNNDVLKEVASQMDFKMSDYWKPTKSNYFSRVKKDALLDIGASLTSLDFIEQHKNKKKGDLAEHIETMPEVATWMPDCLA